MGKLNLSIPTNFSEVGVVDVKVDILRHEWDKHCFISKWNEDYFLCRMTRMSKQKFNLTKDKALEIIKECKLQEDKSELFASGSTFRR